MYLLDTNIIRYALYHPESHPYLVHKVKTTKQRDMFVSMVTVRELLEWRMAGINKKDRLKYTVESHRNLRILLEDLKGMQILDYTEAAYGKFLELPAGVSISDRAIAANAIVNDLTLVTANVRDFEKIPGLKFEDWTVRPVE